MQKKKLDHIFHIGNSHHAKLQSFDQAVLGFALSNQDKQQKKHFIYMEKATVRSVKGVNIILPIQKKKFKCEEQQQKK